MLNAKNLGLAAGIVCGLSVLLATLLSVHNGYGAAFLNLLSSVWPGYTISYAGSLIGAVWGFVDGFVKGFLVAWIYNKSFLK